MPGQWSNFQKNFGKAWPFISPLITFAEYGADLIDLTPFSGVFPGVSVYNNMSTFDDPKATTRDKVVAGMKAALTPTEFIPVIGPAINTVGNAVIDAANYMTDVVEGKKDPPPKPADVNARSNPIGTGVSNAVNFFGNMFRRF
jgi:hypothetical protein